MAADMTEVQPPEHGGGGRAAVAASPSAAGPGWHGKGAWAMVGDHWPTVCPVESETLPPQVTEPSADSRCSPLWTRCW